MCERLAMSANVPTDVRFSFAALSQRGGATSSHTDGWGISFSDHKGCRTIHGPNPSAHSKLARFIRAYPIKSLMVIAHVRKANRARHRWKTPILSAENCGATPGVSPITAN